MEAHSVLFDIVLALIIGAFVVCSIVYFIERSLVKAAQRQRTLLAAIKCIYWLPVFLPALTILYLSIVGAYFCMVAFFHAIPAIVGNGSAAGQHFHAGPLVVLCYSMLIVAFQAWLANISLNHNIGLNGLVAKAGYLLVSGCSLAMLKYNLQLHFFEKSNGDSVGWISFGLIIVTAVIFLAGRLVESQPLCLKYAQVAAKTMVAYCAFCLAFPIAIWMLLFIFKLLF